VLPDDVDPRDLDPQVRQALRSLTTPVADRVAKHLVVAGSIVDEDPEAALAMPGGPPARWPAGPHPRGGGHHRVSRW